MSVKELPGIGINGCMECGRFTNLAYVGLNDHNIYFRDEKGVQTVEIYDTNKMTEVFSGTIAEFISIIENRRPLGIFP